MTRLAHRLVGQPDGRTVHLYGAFARAPSGYQPPALGAGAYQLRWNPLRQEWVLVAAARQGRTYLPERSACPLCPSKPRFSSEIPAARFEVAVFDNRFPAMRAQAGVPARRHHTAGSRPLPSAGACEVVVYTQQHQGAFGTLPRARAHQLAEVWTDRYRELGARPDVDYVLIFENRGEEVGVTLHHPHGQIYGYPFIPPVAGVELGRDRRCRLCRIIAAEAQDQERVLFAAQGTIAYVPAFARWPYEVHVATIVHRAALPDLRPVDRRALADALQRVAAAYDRLFDAPMPYMMVMHQRPTDGGSWPQAHLHVEFYPLWRDRGKLKYLAGSEAGAGVFINDTLAEERAAALRAVLKG
jgi:UDPglucose--hexose-1-phosphate uridylyltransferase